MRCAVYIRVSTNKEEQKLSLTNQRDLFIEYISKKGWDIFDFYVDVESGTTDKRPQLQRLITEAKGKEFDVILAKELSRLARNGRLSYEIRDIAEKTGIEIITLDKAINTLEDNGQMFGIYAWMYEQESQRTSERVREAFRSRSQRGLYAGSNAPYGYTVEKGKLHISQDGTPDTVKFIFREYIEGNGFDSIARQLYNKGIPTPAQVAGKKNATDKWHGSTIRNILENPHYTGDLAQGRSMRKNVTTKIRHQIDSANFIIIADTHQAIVSKSNFEIVQQLIKNRKQMRPQVEKHLFTNTLYCADCGRGMHYKKNRKGYICGNYNKHGVKACSDHIIRESDLQITLLDEIKRVSSVLNDKGTQRKLEKKFKKEKIEFQKKMEFYLKDLKFLRKKKKNSLHLFAEERITKEEYDELVSDINRQIENVEYTIKQIEVSLNPAKSQTSYEELKEQLDLFMGLQKITPEMLHRLVIKIEVEANGSPRIFYRFLNHLFTI